RGDNIPRRAAVSAFGFGGINAHLLIEEWLPPSTSFVFAQDRPLRDRPVSGVEPSLPLYPLEEGVISSTRSGEDGREAAIAVVGMDACFGPWQSLQAFQERVLGGGSAVGPTP